MRSVIQVPPAMIIVWAIAIYRRASLPRLIAMQRRVLAETVIMAREFICIDQRRINATSVIGSTIGYSILSPTVGEPDGRITRWFNNFH